MPVIGRKTCRVAVLIAKNQLLNAATAGIVVLYDDARGTVQGTVGMRKLATAFPPLNQPFTAPSVRPRTKSFIENTNRMITGMAARA